MKHTVEISGEYIDRVFEWFRSTISFNNGRGGAIMLCSNPAETADAFLEWQERQEALSIKGNVNDVCDETEGGSLAFASEPESAPAYYSLFIIKEDCKDLDGNIIIKAFSPKTDGKSL